MNPVKAQYRIMLRVGGGPWIPPDFSKPSRDCNELKKRITALESLHSPPYSYKIQKQLISDWEDI